MSILQVNFTKLYANVYKASYVCISFQFRAIHISNQEIERFKYLDKWVKLTKDFSAISKIITSLMRESWLLLKIRIESW